MEERQFAIETPIGSVASDSGNHVIDVISVSGVILLFLVVKYIMGR